MQPHDVNAATVYVVVEFTYPEYDQASEYDSIVGVYASREEAERAAEHKMRHIEEADLHA